MNVFLAIVGGLGFFALLAIVLGLLQRRSALVRQLKWPFRSSAVALAVLAFAWLATPALAAGSARDFYVLGLVLLAVSLIHLVAIFLFEASLRSGRGPGVPPMMSKVAVGLLYLIVLLFALPAIFGFDVGPFLASGAVTSLVLGLALQPILGNFFAGLVISVERPFRINDWIDLEGTEARVADITWRTTHLRTRDNDNLIVPNSLIANQKLINYYYPNSLHLERVYLHVHYRTAPHRATEALIEAARNVAAILEKPSPEVFVLDFDESAVRYELRIWIRDIAERPRVESEVRKRIWEAFRSRDISFAFPIRTVEIEPRRSTVHTLSGEQKEKTAKEAWLFVEEGADRGLAIQIGSEPVTVGRDEECDLTIVDTKASKRHLQVQRQGRRYLLTDLDSATETRVNGKVVRRHFLETFERIEVGDTVLVFEHDVH